MIKSAKTVLEDKEQGRALEILSDVIDHLDQQNEDITIADQSKFGWLTVFKLRGNDNISSSIKKKVDKIEQTLERNNVKPSVKKSGTNDNKKSYSKNGVQTEREKRGPEETLQFLKGRKRSGVCTHCTESGHFWRECPSYWNSVKQARTQDN